MPVIPSSYAGYTHPTSGNKIVKRALRILGAVPTGEEPSGNEMSDGIEALNQMLDTWNTEALTVYAIVERQFALIAGTQDYTVGPGADFDMVRPGRLQEGDIWLRTGGIDYPLEVYDKDRYSAITQKSTAATIPSIVYYDRAFPFANLTLWPTPDATYTVVFWNPGILAQVTEGVAVISLPPGYAEALSYGLAIRLAPEYGKQVTPEIMDIASVTKGNIKRLNSAPALCAVDDALINGQRRFNINTGQ